MDIYFYGLKTDKFLPPYLLSKRSNCPNLSIYYSLDKNWKQIVKRSVMKSLENLKKLEWEVENEPWLAKLTNCITHAFILYNHCLLNLQLQLLYIQWIQIKISDTRWSLWFSNLKFNCLFNTLIYQRISFKNLNETFSTTIFSIVISIIDNIMKQDPTKDSKLISLWNKITWIM